MHRVIEGNLQTFQKVKLDHVISDLHFGEYSDDKQKILKQYPKTIQNYFQDWNQITRKSEEAYKTEYEYYINAVPARFLDKKASVRTFYKFSMNEASLVKGVVMDKIFLSPNHLMKWILYGLNINLAR